MIQVIRRGETCVERIRVARDPWLRFRGLMSRQEVPAPFGQGLFFPRCRSLHTLFMRFPLDIAFLDEEGNVVDFALNVAPWKAVNGPREAKHCLEVTAGLLEEIQVGDQLEFLTVT